MTKKGKELLKFDLALAVMIAIAVLVLGSILMRVTTPHPIDVRNYPSHQVV